MGITVNELKRVIAIGGDVSAYTGRWHEALANPPVATLPLIDSPKPLPESVSLLKGLGSDLELVVSGWLKGEIPAPEIAPKAGIILLGMPSHGLNTGRFLESAIDEVKPDIIALDITPLWLSAHELYAFSLPCAVGMTIPAQVMTKNLAQLYADETFYPGNTYETAIIKSWLGKIPLVPIGVPVLEAKYSESDFMTAYVDKGAADKELAEKDFREIYKTFDNNLKDITRLQDGAEIAREAASAMMRSIGGKLREDYIEEACYLGSRLADVAAHLAKQGRQAKILTIVNLVHLPDMEDVARLLKDGIIEEFYTEPKNDPPANIMVLAGKTPDKNEGKEEVAVPETTFTTTLFETEFNKWMKTRDEEVLSEADIDRLIPKIVNRTRIHPEIAHGSSVRGTLAMKEVLGGLAELNGGLRRENVLKAALITLSPRIEAKEKDREDEIVSRIAREALYDISSFPADESAITSDNIKWLSPEEIMKNMKGLKPLSEEEKKHLGLSERNVPAIMNDPSLTDKMLKELEAKKLLKKGAQGQYNLTKKALEYMLNELEEKFKNGQISPSEYAAEKSRLTEALKRATQSRFKMSAKDMANTIMEIMDAQDKQWNSQVTFERMHIYYHIKDRGGQVELAPEKRDYYGLKMLIDDLADQGILAQSEDADFNLTGDALDILLDYLIPGDPKGRGLEGAIEFGKTVVNERRQETRKYTAGDVFRDISVRHTLREIAKQKKGLDRVKRGDFRVYTKERRKLQSDIVLCMDTSGSMGFQHKLMYARLAAAGLAKAAIDNGDRVGVVAFNNYGQTTSPMTDKEKDETVGYIVKLSARGNTNIGDGLKCATDMLTGDHSHNQKYIVLITDGEPTAITQHVYDQIKMMKEKDLTEESALLETKKAVAKGIKVSVIHIASEGEPSDAFIRNVARTGGGKVRRIAGPEDLKSIMH